MMNIIIHEVAHAVVGCKHNHDKIWKAKCIEMGGTGQISESPLVRKNPKMYNSTCFKCGTSYHWLRNGVHKCCGAPMKIIPM